jgi:hypothetical protein
MGTVDTPVIEIMSVWTASDVGTGGALSRAERVP